MEEMKYQLGCQLKEEVKSVFIVKESIMTTSRNYSFEGMIRLGEQKATWSIVL